MKADRRFNKPSPAIDLNTFVTNYVTYRTTRDSHLMHSAEFNSLLSRSIVEYIEKGEPHVPGTFDTDHERVTEIIIKALNGLPNDKVAKDLTAYVAAIMIGLDGAFLRFWIMAELNEYLGDYEGRLTVVDAVEEVKARFYRCYDREISAAKLPIFDRLLLLSSESCTSMINTIHNIVTGEVEIGVKAAIALGSEIPTSVFPNCLLETRTNPLDGGVVTVTTLHPGPLGMIGAQVIHINPFVDIRSIDTTRGADPLFLIDAVHELTLEVFGSATDEVHKAEAVRRLTELKAIYTTGIAEINKLREQLEG